MMHLFSLQDKEISQLNDGLSELLRDKEDLARLVENFKTEIEESHKKLLETEEHKSKLKYLNQTKDDKIRELKDKLEELTRGKNHQDLVVTEVN